MSEWTTVTPTTLHRQLKGAEYIINVTDQHADGNYQLILTITFEANISHAQLSKRFPAAWLRTRYRHPLVGVEYPADRLDSATFTALTTVQEAQHWVTQSTEVIHDNSGTSVNDIARGIARRSLNTPNRLTKQYLILGAQTGLSIHTSHALTGHYSIRVLDYVASQLVQDDTELGLSAAFVREDVEELKPRLPASLEGGYEARFHPSKQDIVDELARRQATAEIEQSRQRVGISVHPDSVQRQSDMQNIKITLSASQTSAVRKGIRRAGITPTTALYACLIKAIMASEVQPPDAHGCMLNFSTHGSRWLPCDGQEGAPPISMAIVPSAVWVDTPRQDTIVAQAKRIDAAQRAFLQTPHRMAFATQVAEQLKAAASIGATSASATSPPPPPPSPPQLSNVVLTSQGIIPVTLIHKSANSATALRITDYSPLGRNTDPTVCFVLYTFADVMQLAVIFDGRYFDRQRTNDTLERAATLFKQFGRDDYDAGQTVTARL